MLLDPDGIRFLQTRRAAVRVRDGALIDSPALMTPTPPLDTPTPRELAEGRAQVVRLWQGVADGLEAHALVRAGFPLKTVLLMDEVQRADVRRRLALPDPRLSHPR